MTSITDMTDCIPGNVWKSREVLTLVLIDFHLFFFFFFFF